MFLKESVLYALFIIRLCGLSGSHPTWKTLILRVGSKTPLYELFDFTLFFTIDKCYSISDISGNVKETMECENVPWLS